MPTTYQQQYASINTDSAFIGRITAAAVTAAAAIYANAGASSGAKAFAIKVMANPDAYARQFAWAVVADPTITAASDDPTLFSRINAQWNVLAGI